jgi:hypothetical protein
VVATCFLALSFVLLGDCLTVPETAALGKISAQFKAPNKWARPAVRWSALLERFAFFGAAFFL